MTYFENKEQKEEFIKVWKQATNDPRRKRTTKVYMGTSWRTGKECEIHEGVPGWLTAEHFVLYNILLGKPQDTGFEPVTNKVKLDNGALPMFSYRRACFDLDRLIETARPDNKGWKHLLDRLDKFLEPFAGVVTKEMLMKIPMSKLNPYGMI